MFKLFFLPAVAAFNLFAGVNSLLTNGSGYLIAANFGFSLFIALFAIVGAIKEDK